MKDVDAAIVQKVFHVAERQREPDTVAAGEAARRLGVSPATIQRWVDSGLLASRRTAGGHRRISLTDLHRLLALLRPPEIAGPLGAWLKVLLTGDAQKVRHSMLSAREKAGSWCGAVDEIAAAIVELGRVWEIGSCAVYEEHVATESLRRAAAWCAERILIPGNAPKALLLTVEGERHTLGLSLAELILREKGWRPIWIGEGPPAGEIFRMIRQLAPDLVVVSGSARLSRRSVAAYERWLDVATSDPPTRILLAGGAAWITNDVERRVANFLDFGAKIGRSIT